ncbi:hypothetical protein SLS62_009064 [Diatrype stigma]|uniref:beta-galactosidase n=1 Tax=Diatrype stigma TaxID=117547 RepID=A0AAN9UJE3_9PEZI
MRQFLAVALAVLAESAATASTPFRGPLPRAQGDNATNTGPSTDRWPSGLHLAVDYYPSQWPEEMWEPDISGIRDANMSYVRINEFDWALLEPTEGQYNFTVLDKTLELLGRYGLKAIIGTPTAAPPNWLTEKYDIDFVDRTNATLQFGSRRHYSFSSFDYRKLSQDITRKLAERYGDHPAVAGWQLDNEFGCHDTVRSYDHNAAARFRTWLEAKYGTIESLNHAQGRVFWSQQYASFEAVQPPFLEVYTLNEAHTLDWYAFSSDMVIDFAREQAAILRQHAAPAQFVTTNFMVLTTDFDHHKFAREVGIDLATFDQYALAGMEAFAWLSDQQLAGYLRTGIPDLQAFNHALYRGVAGAAYANATAGPFGVMEMQPGVLNWGQYRVSPAEGMVRLWTHETFAEAGDLVSYFRWRQLPYAQEQTLSGLHVSDNTEDVGLLEAQIVATEDLPKLRAAAGADLGSPQEYQKKGDVALVFDYTSHWVWAIEPYSGTWDVKEASYTDPALKYTDLVFVFFSALRRLGLSVDVIGPDQPLDGYKMVVVPSLPIVPPGFDAALARYAGPVVFGPHTASHTPEFSYVPGLSPGGGGPGVATTLRDRLPMRVTRVETPPSYANSGVAYAGRNYSIEAWEEWVVCERQNRSSTATVTYTSRHRRGAPAAACSSSSGTGGSELHYLAFNPPVDLLVAYLGDVAAGADITDVLGRPVERGDGNSNSSSKNDLGETLRFARRGNLLWAFNYGLDPVALPEEINGGGGAELIIGENGGELPGAGVAVWRIGGGSN